MNKTRKCKECGSSMTVANVAGRRDPVYHYRCGSCQHEMKHNMLFQTLLLAVFVPVALVGSILSGTFAPFKGTGIGANELGFVAIALVFTGYMGLRLYRRLQLRHYPVLS